MPRTPKNIQKLPSGKFRAAIMLGGQRHSKTFDRQRDATKWIERVRADHQRGVFIPPDRQREKVSDRLTVWLDNKAADPNFADSTLRCYTSLTDCHIRPRLGNLTLEHLTVERVEQWRNDLVNEHGPSVAREAHKVLSSFLSSQRRYGYVSDNVAQMVPRASVPRREYKILSPWDLRAVADRMAGAPCSMPAEPNRWGTTHTAMPSDHPEWELRSGWAADIALGLAMVGCRGGDFSRLRPEDWDQINGRLFVRDSKTGNDRWLPVFEELRVVLERCVARGGEFLFMHDGKAGQSPFASGKFIRNHWYPALDACGVERVRPHDLRHTCASWLVSMGFGPVQVAAYLGHSSPTVTLHIYAHLFADDMADMGEALNSMMQRARPDNVTDIRKAE